MAKLSKDISAGNLHPRENLSGTGNLGALNAEVQIESHGCATVSIDLRGTFVATVQVQGSVDGVNWVLIPVRSAVGGPFAAGVTAVGVYSASCVGFTRVRAIVTAYTSGTATTVIAASLALFDDFARMGGVTNQIVTAVGAAAAAVTVTLPAPGAGLRHYITYLSMNRFASALLTAGAAPVTVTTTNLPGSLAFSFAADAAAAGSMDRWREDFAFPIASSAQNTATTIVMPATTGVIWRGTVGYYIAP